MASCEKALKYFDKMQSFPVADLFHIGIGFLIYHYIYFLFVPILYTIVKLRCIKKENISTRFVSILEYFLGFSIALAIDKI